MSDHTAHTNIPEPHAPESPARGRKMFWIKLLSAMALILLGVFVMYRVVAYRALNQRIQAVRDAGYPIEPAELNDWYATPEVNASDAYLRAFAAFPMDHELEGYENIPIVTTMEEKFVLGEPLGPEMAKRIEAYLAHYDETIPLLEEAALIEHGRYPGDYRLGFNLLLTHVGQLRRSARVLKLQSILDHDRGDHDLAAQRCITILAIARSLDKEPVIISALVNIGIQALAYEQIEMLVASGKLGDAQLQKLADAVERIDLDRIMLRAMVGERCSIHGYFGDSEMLAGLFTSNATVGRAGVAALRTSGLLDIDHSSSLDIMQEYVEFAEDPTWPLPTQLDDIDNRVPRICVVTRMVIPALSSAYRASRQCEARRRALLTGIAAERYRQIHNRFPTQLTDLAPEFIDAVPLDPFDDQPLRYRTEDAGVIIYSLGADGIDNHGRRYNDVGRDFQDSTDVTFTFGGLQEQLWPQPEVEEEDYGDPYGYGGGYGGIDDDGETFEVDDQTEDVMDEEPKTKEAAENDEVDAEKPIDSSTD